MTTSRLRAAGRLTRSVAAATATLLAIGCIVEDSDASKKATADSAAQPATASTNRDTAGSVAAEISAPAYNLYSLDTAGLGAQMDSLPPLATDPGYSQITATSAVASPRKFP